MRSLIRNKCGSMSRRIVLSLACLAGLFAAGAAPREAHAAPPPGKWVAEYHVQVEYWYWDSDYYYWSTVYKSENYNAAQFVYALSLLAEQNGNLNAVWPHTNWKFIAMDVRLVTVWKFVPAPRISASQYELR